MMSILLFSIGFAFLPISEFNVNGVSAYLYRGCRSDAHLLIISSFQMEECIGMPCFGAFLYCHVGYLTIRRTVKQFFWRISLLFLIYRTSIYFCKWLYLPILTNTNTHYIIIIKGASSA